MSPTSRGARVTFIRNFRRPTGGNIKFRDYFLHAACDPTFDSRIWFTPGSRHAQSSIWSARDFGRVLENLADRPHDLICVNGKDWKYLPEALGSTRVLHFVQHAGYLDDPFLRKCLDRPAFRVCTNAFLADQIRPFANGPVEILPIGLHDSLHEPPIPKIKGSVMILGIKQPSFAKKLAESLCETGIESTVVGLDWIDHDRLIEHMRTAEIFVGLPAASEGCYLPALEAMASACTVICADAGGTRGHCIDGVTCLQPPALDLQGHVAAVRRAMSDDDLCRRLRINSLAMAAGHCLAQEGHLLRRFLARALSPGAGRGTV
ncbi:glycosyltransferase [Xylophilus sp. GOD-11R]|uniref:glycosyltransferase n=1 Tax=Xylophilus sp. GOD-11R TaxID=3089814 RepID=UPI00298C22B9|nr:glycosyltransferase [Xylophilus sp. GOD-11R]WPB57542.1 glycosyltransferase [Xylophilus sp. GOD-11R]